MENLSQRTQDFFTDVVEGNLANHKPVKPYQTFEDFKESDIRHLKSVARVFDGYKGNFDEHIACSIPTFRECQLAKAWAIASALPKGGSVLDIGGSEGTMLKTAASLAPDGFFFNLEPNEDMCRSFNQNKPENCLPIPQAFQEGFGDVPKYNPYNPAYDVINETMTFQFIKKDRVAFIDEVKRMLKPEGVFFTEEKFRNNKTWLYQNRETFKDLNHKSKYFTVDQITAKAEAVLTGMQELQAYEDEYVSLLKSKFKHVYAYWRSGNFAGFICSDSHDSVALYGTLLGAALLQTKYSNDTSI